MEGTNLYALLAMLVPLIVAVFASTKTPSWVRGLVAFIVSIAVAAVAVLLKDPAHVATIELYAGTAITVIALAQASYSMLWKPLGVTSWILEHIGNVFRGAK